MASFPRMIFELLDGCISEEQKETPNKFPVLLYSDCDLDVTFKIQETTQYNILAHLKLQLRKGNDAKVTLQSFQSTIFVKGVFSKPSGKYIVSPNICFLS